jgi:hypothetical protein
MRATLLDAVSRSGVITRSEALAIVAEHVLDDALAAGLLVRIFPEVYTRPDAAEEVATLRHGALAHRPAGALSHTDALDAWRLPTALSEGVHVTVSADEPSTEWPGLRLHRRSGYQPTTPFTMVRDGLRVVRIEQAIVESWPLLPAIDRRSPAIVALRERRTTGERLLKVLGLQPKTAGAAQMRHVFELAAAGCHSPLEMWGHEKVFSDRRLPPSRCQVPVVFPGGQRVYLDRLFEELLVNVELDGATYHGRPGQRERDLLRDAALAVLGYVTVRFSHQRLHADPEGVIRQLLAILARRREQLRNPAA